MIEFRFAHPFVLVLLLAPVAAFWLSRRQKWSPAPSAMRYSDTHLLGGEIVNWRIRLRRLPDALRLVAWLMVLLALARPQSGRAQEIIRGQGIDIVLALDISGSMCTLDFDPLSRLQAAKSVIGDFINRREYDRIGLVVFARSAFHQAPPTLDYSALKRLLEEVRLATELGLEDGTAIGLGLASAANMLRSSAAASKVIVLLTDGDNNAGLDPITASEALAALGIKVYAVGIGTSGTVPLCDQPDVRVENVLNEEVLRRVAESAGGLYFRAEDLAGLEQIYDEINRLERSEVNRQVYVRWQEQAAPLMAGGLLLLVLERFLRQTVFQSVP